jgi:hypothetical protein
MASHLFLEMADVIAHQVQFMVLVAVGWMHRQFRRGKCEDQPSAAYVNVVELQHIPEEGFVRFCIRGVNDGVGTGDHGLDLKFYKFGPDQRHQRN